MVNFLPRVLGRDPAAGLCDPVGRLGHHHKPFRSGEDRMILYPPRPRSGRPEPAHASWRVVAPTRVSPRIGGRYTTCPGIVFRGAPETGLVDNGDTTISQPSTPVATEPCYTGGSVSASEKGFSPLPTTLAPDGDAPRTQESVTQAPRPRSARAPRSTWFRVVAGYHPPTRTYTCPTRARCSSRAP